MIKLGNAIIQVLEKRKMWRQYQQYFIIDQWEQLAGKNIAAVTDALGIERQVLRVKVRSSTWAYHLTLLKPQLIKKINQHAGEKLVRDIFFQIGTDDWD